MKNNLLNKKYIFLENVILITALITISYFLNPYEFTTKELFAFYLNVVIIFVILKFVVYCFKSKIEHTNIMTWFLPISMALITILHTINAGINTKCYIQTIVLIGIAVLILMLRCNCGIAKSMIVSAAYIILSYGLMFPMMFLMLVLSET